MISLQYRMRTVRFLAPLALSLLGGVALPLVTPTPAHAQQQFGIVDWQSCAAQSKLRKELDLQLNTFGKTVSAVFDRLREGNVIFLNKQEMNEVAVIYEKGDKATAAENTRVTELLKKADQSAGTLNRLAATQGTLKDTEKKELERLSNLQNEGVTLLNEVGANFKLRIKEKEEAADQQLEKAVKEAVKKVAQEKNLAMVFNSNIVIYASTDITDDVVKILQK